MSFEELKKESIELKKDTEICLKDSKIYKEGYDIFCNNIAIGKTNFVMEGTTNNN